MQTIDRATLRFAEAVEKNFGFISAHGFQRVRSEPTLVRFEAKHAYVNVYHGRKSFEVGLEVGSLTTSAEEASYAMSEIIRLLEPGKAAKYRDYAAHDANGVHEGVERLATIFRRYIDAGALDKIDLFGRLAKQREIWKEDYAREVNLSDTRRRVDASWHAKDYAKVVELLRPYRASLTSSELHKLEYAQKKVRGDGKRGQVAEIDVPPSKPSQ